MDLDKAIKERHCVRRFSSKKVDYEDIIEAIDSANKSPLAGNISTLRFILVTNKEKIEKIADACQQDFVSKANYAVIVCSDITQCIRSYGERGERYSKQQAGAAIENFLLKITDLKLASCWVGAFADNMIKHALKIPENINIEAVLPIGYEFGKSRQRKKPELDNILFFNTWKEKHLKPIRVTEAL